MEQVRAVRPYNREKCSHQHSHVRISPGDRDHILGVTQHGATWNGAKWARNTAWRTGVAASGAEEDRRVSSEEVSGSVPVIRRGQGSSKALWSAYCMQLARPRKWKGRLRLMETRNLGSNA